MKPGAYPIFPMWIRCLSRGMKERTWTRRAAKEKRHTRLLMLLNLWGGEHVWLLWRLMGAERTKRFLEGKCGWGRMGVRCCKFWLWGFMKCLNGAISLWWACSRTKLWKSPSQHNSKYHKNFPFSFSPHHAGLLRCCVQMNRVMTHKTRHILRWLSSATIQDKHRHWQ